MGGAGKHLCASERRRQSSGTEPGIHVISVGLRFLGLRKFPRKDLAVEQWPERLRAPAAMRIPQSLLDLGLP